MLIFSLWDLIYHKAHATNAMPFLSRGFSWLRVNIRNKSDSGHTLKLGYPGQRDRFSAEFRITAAHFTPKMVNYPV